MIVILVLVLVSAIALLDVVFAAEILVGLLPGRDSAPAKSTGSAVIVMPANNEAAVIGETLSALHRVMNARSRVLVVADNCADDTADLARAAGAEVLVRNDTTQVGKGFALAHARDHLVTAPPDVVVVLDADCQIDAQSLERLIDAAATSGRPVQGISLLRPDLAAAPMVQVSNFAFAVKNLLRNVGLQRISGAALLTGTGMAFPWALFRSAPLANDDVVEDLRLGLDFKQKGFPPLLLREATVWSAASTSDGTMKQRTRWEGGFLSTSVKRSGAMFSDALLRLDPRALWGALSMLVPPLSLLAMMNAVAVGATAGAWIANGSPAPLAIAATAAVFALVAVVAAWSAIGRRYLSASSALSMPFYVLWKIPMYFRLFRRGPPTWLRTGR